MSAILPEERFQKPRDSKVDIMRFSQGVYEGMIRVEKNASGKPRAVRFEINDPELQEKLDAETAWINAELRLGKDLGAVLLPRAKRGEETRDLSVALARMLLVRFHSGK